MARIVSILFILALSQIVYADMPSEWGWERLSPEIKVKGTHDGTLRTFKDGVVECVLYRGWQSAAIDCNAETAIDIKRLPESAIILKNYSVVRQIVNNKVCYIYSNNQNSDMSCLKL